MAAVTNGIAYHGALLPFGATFFNFVDYCKPALRLAAPRNIHYLFVFTHDSFFLGEDGRRISRSSSSRCCARRRTVVVVRPADSLETLEAWKLMIADGARSVGARAHASEVAVPRQTRRGRLQGGVRHRRSRRRHPDLILIATGSEVSLAIDAKKLLDAKGQRVRVVSMPSWELFDAQTQAYQRLGAAAVGARRACRSKPERRSAGRATSAIAASPSASITSARRRRPPFSRRRSGLRRTTSPTRHRYVRTRNPLGENL